MPKRGLNILHNRSANHVSPFVDSLQTKHLKVILTKGGDVPGGGQLWMNWAPTKGENLLTRINRPTEEFGNTNRTIILDMGRLERPLRRSNMDNQTKA